MQTLWYLWPPSPLQSTVVCIQRLMRHNSCVIVPNRIGSIVTHCVGITRRKSLIVHYGWEKKLRKSVIYRVTGLLFSTQMWPLEHRDYFSSFFHFISSELRPFQLPLVANNDVKGQRLQLSVCKFSGVWLYGSKETKYKESKAKQIFHFMFCLSVEMTFRRGLNVLWFWTRPNYVIMFLNTPPLPDAFHFPLPWLSRVSRP